MRLKDRTDYYRNLIDSGRYEIKTPAEALDAVGDLVEEAKVNIQFHMEQIREYFAVYDSIEGFIPIDPEVIQDEVIYEIGESVFYINAIIKKFPELRESISEGGVYAAIEELENIQATSNEISGDLPERHQAWKDEILSSLYDALDAISSI